MDPVDRGKVRAERLEMFRSRNRGTRSVEGGGESIVIMYVKKKEAQKETIEGERDRKVLNDPPLKRAPQPQLLPGEWLSSSGLRLGGYLSHQLWRFGACRWGIDAGGIDRSVI